MSSTRRLCAVALVALVSLSACTADADDTEPSSDADATEAAAASAVNEGEAPTIVQPGAPGEPNRVLDPSEAAALTAPAPHTEADVRFMQMMIPHHAQALEMTALIAERTAREDLPLFARRLDISQEGEIELMQRWLEDRGEEAPDPGSGHEHGDHGDHSTSADGLMPGMLTEEEMAALEAAEGEDFDRLFLESMIRHHEGALLMVEELFAQEDAAQETEILQYANHVLSDQAIEISRMQTMLAEMDAAPE